MYRLNPNETVRDLASQHAAALSEVFDEVMYRCTRRAEKRGARLLLFLPGVDSNVNAFVSYDMKITR